MDRAMHTTQSWLLRNVDFYANIMVKLCFGTVTMVLEWWEREHVDIDSIEISDPMTLNALWRCGFLNFYHTSKMHAQVSFLETLVSLWDHDLIFFDLQEENLELTTEDIYFITNLSHRGALDYRRGRKNNFKYARILVFFFFERFLSLSLVVTLPPCPPCDPRLTRWGDIFLRYGGGDAI